MSGLLTTLIFLIFQAGTILVTESQDDFINDCPPSLCGDLEIRFPLALSSGPHYCKHFANDISLSCIANDTLLSSSLGPFKVTTIDYFSSFISISPSSFPACPWLSLDHLFENNTDIYELTYFTVISCSTKLTLSMDNGSIAGPIDCLSGRGYSVYVVEDSDEMTMDWLPSYCTTISNGLLPSVVSPPQSFRDIVQNFGNEPEVGMYYGCHNCNYSDDTEGCQRCQNKGEGCGYSRAKNQTFCIPVHHSSHHTGLLVALVSGLSIVALIIVISVTIMYNISQKTSKAKETRRKVEQFLSSYKAAKPTRYSYASIRKITKKFKHKLGEGGYGSVYKGELSNEIPIAVKMLQISGSDGEEFINEVSTIGRIHHVNVVRLLGFCSEGTRRALVYEFMPNKSLDKFIFSDATSRAYRPFSMQKLLEIAIGIAQGIEYLHQGCNQRILHFDIKPHNILLDHDFNPKISDFGLAKICSKDQSIVTMTAARGTMGYIAPEIYSRNFGTVSYKSDVYSFGMLTLEMVSGRRNIDPMTGNQTEDYFPEWIYDRLIEGKDLGLDLEMDCDKELRKLAMIALWCVQWSPADRPSMTRVVQMLMGNLESLEMPPKPFVSSSGQYDVASTIEV